MDKRNKRLKFQMRVPLIYIDAFLKISDTVIMSLHVYVIVKGVHAGPLLFKWGSWVRKRQVCCCRCFDPLQCPAHEQCSSNKF